MAAGETEFKAYWEDALSAVHRQIASAQRACEELDQERPLPQKSLAVIQKRLQRQRPRVKVVIAAGEKSPGSLIKRDSPEFGKALAWLQSELFPLVKKRSSGSEADEADVAKILRILSYDATTTEEHFGSVTDGWDTLVALRQDLLPETAPRLAWFVSVMSEFERALRQSVCLAIQHFGRTEPVREALRTTAKTHAIALDIETVSGPWSRTEDAIAQAFSDFMRAGADRTVRVAETFCDALTQTPFEVPAFTDGFFLEMRQLGSTTNEVVATLIRWQDDILHDASLTHRYRDGARDGSDHAAVELLRYEKDDLAIVPQFLCAENVLASLRIMRALSEALCCDEGSDIGEAGKVGIFKAAGELRVSDLRLLKLRRYWLAWALADITMALQFEDKATLMPRYNAIFAQKQLNIPGWNDELVKMTPGEAPRFQLLHMTLSEQWNGITDVIVMAVKTKDMTRDELQQWPALEALRQRQEYQNALAILQDRQ
jgi:hypothetical protein